MIDDELVKAGTSRTRKQTASARFSRMDSTHQDSWHKDACTKPGEQPGWITHKPPKVLKSYATLQRPYGRCAVFAFLALCAQVLMGGLSYGHMLTHLDLSFDLSSREAMRA